MTATQKRIDGKEVVNNLLRVWLIILDANGREFPQVGKPASIANYRRTLLRIHRWPFARARCGGRMPGRLPRHGQSILNGGNNLALGDGTATTGKAVLQQPDNLAGGKMRVQISGHTKQPSMDTLAGSRWSIEHVAKELRQLARHCKAPC
jgi:hypothetical protein